LERWSARRTKPAVKQLGVYESYLGGVVPKSGTTS
jgi:hypothetical protein